MQVQKLREARKQGRLREAQEEVPPVVTQEALALLRVEAELGEVEVEVGEDDRGSHRQSWKGPLQARS